MDCRRGALIKKPDGGYALSGLQIRYHFVGPVAREWRLRPIRPTDSAPFCWPGKHENSDYTLSGPQIRHDFVGPVSARIAVTPYPAYRFYAVCQAR